MKFIRLFFIFTLLISVGESQNTPPVNVPWSSVSGITGAIKKAFGGCFDGGGSAISTSKVAYNHITNPGTITAWKILVDTGTATFKVWRIAAGTAIPTVSNSISTSGLSISTGTNVKSTVLSDFTSTAIAADDIIAVSPTAISGATQACLTVEYQ